MLTPLGRFLRKIRIDHGEILANMAEKLGVTASYVSAVENGKRTMPREWRDKISAMYSLGENQKAEFEGLVLDSIKTLSFSAENTSRMQKEVAFTFARKMAELPEDKLLEIRKILGRDAE